MATVKGLGHVAIYVRDLERMVEFYRDLLGMRITKQNWRAGVVFLSADPASVDHEIALFRGRPDGAEPHLINQISRRADLAPRSDARRFACLSSAIGGRRSADRRGGKSCQRSRLLLLRSRRQSFGSVLADRPGLLGADRASDRYRAAR